MSTRDPGLQLSVTAAVAMLVLVGAYSWWLMTALGDSALAAEGRQLYLEQCSNCHGVDLEGEADWMRRKPNGRLPAPPHDASGTLGTTPTPSYFES